MALLFLPRLTGGLIAGFVTARIVHLSIILFRRRRTARVVLGQGRELMRIVTMTPLRLGINIDHVATVRNARGSGYPEPVRAALLAEQSGADGITAHLREDRRHISDADIEELMEKLTLPLNLEMAATGEMQAIAIRHAPHAVCLVPEKREELTTESGLDVAGHLDRLSDFVVPLKDAGSRVSLFIGANHEQIDAARAVGADVVEFHTGTYCDLHAEGNREGCEKELAAIRAAISHADQLGLEVHAGHGLTFDTVAPIAAIGVVRELNIGHFLIGEAIFTGLDAAIRKMRSLMNDARA